MKIYLVWSSEPSSHDFNEGMMDEIKFEQIPIISFEALAETMNTLHGTSNVFYSIRHMT